MSVVAPQVTHQYARLCDAAPASRGWIDSFQPRTNGCHAAGCHHSHEIGLQRRCHVGLLTRCSQTMANRRRAPIVDGAVTLATWLRHPSYRRLQRCCGGRRCDDGGHLQRVLTGYALVSQKWMLVAQTMSTMVRATQYALCDGRDAG